MATIRATMWAMVLSFAAAAGLPAMGQGGLLGHWKMDEGAGDAVTDSSPHAHDGDVVGACWARGPFGSALHFDGQGDLVRIAQFRGLDGAEQMTLEAWVMWEEGGRYPNIVTGGRWSPGGFLIFVTDRNCYFRMGTPGCSAADGTGKWGEVGVKLVNNFEIGRWYHLVVVFRRPELTSYVDGVKVDTARWDYPVGYSGDLIIGSWGGDVSHRGLIDEVKLYNRALSAEEVAASYAAEAQRRSGQVSYELVPDNSRPEIVAEIGNRYFRMQIDARGRCVSFVDRATGEELLRQPAPMVALRAGGRALSRVRCSFANDTLTYSFGRDEAEAQVAVHESEDYVTFRVVNARGQDLEALSFVRLPLTLTERMSATSGLMGSDKFGVCLRALNIDTFAELNGRERTLVASARAEYGIIGCGAALVACPSERLLPALRSLVQRERLPKSELGGPWALEAEGNRGSYLFSDVSEANVDWWIDLALRGGFACVHFSSFEETLGHYEPRASLFPNGIEGMKECVRRIHAAGLKAGMHTLTGCISPRDSWVTPVPDPRLAADASYTLAADMTAESTTILTVEKPHPHDTVFTYAGSGNVIRIGQELIQYSAISFEPPYGFLNCTRGAFKTTPAAHSAGERADHLRQRYIAFYPDERSTLVGEVADAIARIYNECEMDQIYMDGAEGMGSNHGISVMRDAIYRRLKRPAIVEASAWDAWSWYYHSRIGAWDHPKWALKDFHDSHIRAIPSYRDAGLLQAQLGWWVILGPSSMNRLEMPDEMEYFLCKTLAHDAPMSIQGIGALGRPANARMEEYLTMTGRYERLRLARYFNDQVLATVGELGRDFHLRQADDGVWEFVPTDYQAHRVSSGVEGSERWQVTNRFGPQPAGLRVEALFSSLPYDSEGAVTVADFADPAALTVHRDAPKVTHEIERVREPAPVGEGSLRFSATNSGDTRTGAWAHAGMRFEPYLDLRGKGAIGVWVHGDGSGALLNIQLSNPDTYMRAWSEHYVDLDFTGWRYFELLLRERDAERWDDYTWPYGGQHNVYRTFLDLQHVSELNLYLNNLPPGQTTTVYLSPIVALPTTSVALVRPTITINHQTLTLPATLSSGHFAEVDPSGEMRVYDWRGELLTRGQVEGPMPPLRAGANAVSWSCPAPPVGTARAEVVVIAQGEPVRGMRPEREVDWAALRYEYEMPRLIEEREGAGNRWMVPCRAQGGRPVLGVELMAQGLGASGAAYNSPEALTIESFDDLSYFADSPDNQFAKYVYDSQHQGTSTKPGVTQQIERSTDVVKIGASSARYSATSTLPDNSGWSARGRRFVQPLDLSAYSRLGFWLHGDARGEAFKLQLRDTTGAWHDMVTGVDFTGWRYVECDLAGAKLDLSKIEYIIIYFNAIPGGQTVTCYMDDLRALPPAPPIATPTLACGGARTVLPVTLGEGDRLVYRGPQDCRLYRRGSATPEAVRPEGATIRLRPGPNEVSLSFAEGTPDRFRLAVTVIKDYGGGR